MPITIDLTPDTLDLVLYAGDGCDFQISFVDDFDLAVDVSDWTWRAQIRSTRKSIDYTPLTIDYSGASNGVIIVGISKEITREIASGINTASQWDLESLASGSENPVTILQGSVYCNMDVTK